MAGNAKTIDAARRWTELADEYEELAASIERSGRPAVARMPMQQQPIQQPQVKQRSK